MLIIHFTDHPILENTIISILEPGKVSSGVGVCIYTDTSHKQRKHRWLQPVQSLNQGKRGPWLGYGTWDAFPCLPLIMLRVGRPRDKFTVILYVSPLLHHVSGDWDAGIPCPNGAKPISKACTSPFPRSTFRNVDQISSVIIPRLYERPRKRSCIREWGWTECTGGRGKRRKVGQAPAFPLWLYLYFCSRCSLHVLFSLSSWWILTFPSKLAS